MLFPAPAPSFSIPSSISAGWLLLIPKLRGHPPPQKAFLDSLLPLPPPGWVRHRPPGFHGYLSACVLLNLSEWAELLRGMCPLADGELFESRDQVSVTPVTVQGLA